MIFPSISIISMSHSRGEFFGVFFLPNLDSIDLHMPNNIFGSWAHLAFTTMFKNSGFFGFGQEGVL